MKNLNSAQLGQGCVAVPIQNSALPEETTDVFIASLRAAMREFVVSDGANFQAAVDVINEKFPTLYRLSVKRVAADRFEAVVINSIGGIEYGPADCDFNEIGMMFCSLAHPHCYNTAIRSIGRTN